MYCGLCLSKYNQTNPPRLIPICGHTFCQNCLNLKINQCLDTQIFLRCPIDGKIMYMQLKDINNFPKNIGIIKQMNGSPFKEDRQLCQSLNLFGSQQTINQKEVHNMTKSSNYVSSVQQFDFQLQQQSILKTHLLENDQFQIDQRQICLLHKKKLQIICLQDRTGICSSCAIFGEHKGHHFKSVDQLNNDKDKKYQQMLNICDRKQLACLMIKQQQCKQQISKLLKVKRQSLVELIKQKHAKLYDILRVSQKRTIQKLNKYLLTLEQKIRHEIKMRQQPLLLYKQWQEKALRKMEILESKINLQQQLKILNYQNNFYKHDIVEEGNKIVSMIENINKIHKSSPKQIFETINIQFSDQIQKKLHSYASIKISSIQDDLAQQTILKQNSIDQYLLDQTQQSNTQSRRASINYQQKYPKVTLRNVLSGDSTINKKSSLMHIYQSPKNRDFVSNSTNTKQIIKKKIKVKIAEKFQKIIEGILNDNSDLLDLTNGELGDQTILQILQTLKNKKTRIIKLVRNKLSDQMICQIWPLIGNVSTLNLSQNNLSDRVLDSLLINFKKVPNLKNIILSQNKLKERNIKGKLQEIRKLDIIVSL